MNTEIMKGNWQVTKAKLRQQFRNLTDDDLEFTEGREDDLIARIQKRTGGSRDEIVRILEQPAPAAARGGGTDVRSGPGAENLPSGGWAGNA